jgi:hypothetical protein
MSRGDYLFDPTQAPGADDADVVALERALMPLRTRLGDGPVPEPGGWRWRPWLLTAGVAAAAALALWFWSGGFGSGDGVLRPGAPARTFVAKVGRLTIPVQDLAELTIAPGSEFDFVHWRDDELRFRLRRGELTAKVEPPPKVAARFFVVDTPLGRVIDEGCQYVLVVREDGSASVATSDGAVTFAGEQREVFVPAGAAATISRKGVSTPLFAGTSSELRTAVRDYDRYLDAGELTMRYKVAKMLFSACRQPRDSLPLYHVLLDPDPQLRGAAAGELRNLVGAPDGGAEPGRAFDAAEWRQHLREKAW